MLHKSLAD